MFDTMCSILYSIPDQFHEYVLCIDQTAINSPVFQRLVWGEPGHLLP